MLSSVTTLVSKVGGPSPAPSGGVDGALELGEAARRGRPRSAGGWPQLSQASVAVGACQRASTAVTKKSGLSSARMTSSMVVAACTRSCPLRRAARSAPRAEALRPAAVGPVAGGVGDRQPCAVAVLDEVEPVAADLVGGQQRPGELRAGDARDARREQVVLDLGGGRRGLAPPRGLDDVGVVVGELERRGALLGDVLQRDDRRADAEQQPDDAPAQPQRHGDAARQATLERLVERRQPLGHDLGPQRRRRVERLGEVLGARQADELRAIDVDDVQGDGDARGAARLGHELIGDEVGRHLVEDVGDLERERLGASEAAGRLIGEARPAARDGCCGGTGVAPSSASSARAADSASRVAKWR